MIEKDDQRKLLSAYCEIAEVMYQMKNQEDKKRLKIASEILSEMIDEDVFQE